MPWENAITIKSALERIQRNEYVLPAIQRELVWKQPQICYLFDSLMRGYPIGSFLFWRIAPERLRDYKYYSFVVKYHQRDNPHCPELDVLPSGAGVVAVLDGQQRLTALNIGLRGSHTIKQPRLHWSNPVAFPQTSLHLNVLAKPSDDDQALAYDFEFLTDDQARARDAEHFWFPVRKILEFPDTVAIFNYLHAEGLNTEQAPFRMLDRLHRLIHVEPLILPYTEDAQDIDKVLNIFIRTNSGGTQLSYSDLLLSIATAQWQQRDARAEIHQLVDEINDIGNGFSISKDFVLKSGLMLTEIASVGFRVENFTAENMAKLEANWEAIKGALLATFRLAASYGFSAQNLGADAALHTIAYYLFAKQFTGDFTTSPSTLEDRRRIRGWLLRSLLKSGVWGSGLDVLLTAIRAAIREAGTASFPVEAIESAMARRGRVLKFTDEEIEDLLDAKYGDRRTFAMLSLLYPTDDISGTPHIDHVFPRALFARGKLAAAGVPQDQIPEFQRKAECVPNLQLLPASDNTSKSSRLPLEWIMERLPDPHQRDAYVERHDLGEIPAAITEFSTFYEARAARLAAKLKALLQG